MNDRECVLLLQWALPQLGLRWEGFRGLRRQVCRRISARMRAIGVTDGLTYRQLLESDAEERFAFDALCHITISRFYRDRRTFEALRDVILPEVAELACSRRDPALRIWSAGCASGEEPYTLAIMWHLELAARFQDAALDIVANDLDDEVLARAARGSYEASSLREIPPHWREAAFDADGDLFSVRLAFRKGVTFRHQDVRLGAPPAPLHLVLCRNLAFTYFDVPAQRDFVRRVAERLVPGGMLIVGGHEALPDGTELVAREDIAKVYWKPEAGRMGGAQAILER